MHSHRQGIEEALTTTKGQLEKLHTDIGRTLEKISSREKYLNNQLEAPLGDFKRLSDNLAAAREQYKSVSGGKYLHNTQHPKCFQKNTSSMSFKNF